MVFWEKTETQYVTESRNATKRKDGLLILELMSEYDLNKASLYPSLAS